MSEQDTETLLQCFEKIPIRPGDVFIVPGGMPHAIGEGVLMIEIMEPTDFAVRIEFERGGYVLPEASRFMNWGDDFANSMFNFDAWPIDLLKQTFFCEPRMLEKQNESAEYAIIDESKTACFRVNRIHVKDRFVKKSDRFYTGIVSQGSGTLRIGNKTYPLKPYTRFFVPYQTGAVIFESDTGMEITATFPPE